MKSSSIFYLTVLLLFGIFNFGRGENCGGVLSRHSGHLKYRPGSSKGNCVWFIQALRGQSVSITLETLTHSLDELNVYPETDLSSDSQWPIKLTSLDLNSPVNVSGSTLLLTWSRENSGAFSVSWRSDLIDDGLKRRSAVNQIQSDEGQILWDDFEPGVVTTAWLDISVTSSSGTGETAGLPKSLSLTLSKDFPACSRPDPCDCNFLSIYEISSYGFLRSLERLCGRPMANYTISKLPTRIFAFFLFDSPVKSNDLDGEGNLAKEFLEIYWRMETGEPPEPSTTTTTTTTEIPSKDLICPENEVIFPCTCSPGSIHRANVYCSGVNTTQETFVNLFLQLRAINDLTPDETLQFYSFTVQDSPITQLDLTPFMNLRLTGYLLFYNSSSLTSIVKGQEVIERSIQVPRLQFLDCPLTDQGFGDALKYFDTSMTILSFHGSNMSGGHYALGNGSEEVEFLPGLSAFTNLKEFTMEYSRSPDQIRISGGQFRRNINLETLGLASSRLTFGDDAFLFDESPPHLLDKKIIVAFHYTESIRNADFDEGTRLTRSSRPIELAFWQSGIDFLGEENFKDFLLGHPKNTVDLGGTPGLICDVRMKWLKDNRDLYEPHVLGGECSNDPDRRPIWNSDFIP